MAALSATKSKMLMDFIQGSQGFYYMPVVNGVRSRVNVPFRVCNGVTFDTDMEAKFIKEAEKEKILQVKGHRSVGGLRISMYNAITVENIQVLIEFMKKFMETNK